MIISVQYACETPGYASINVFATQGTGNRLVRGDGNVNNVSNPDLIACDGALHTVPVTAYNYGSVPFKKGKATVTADLYQDGYPVITTGAQTVSIK